MQYEKPTLADYGTLRELTAVAFPGIPLGMASISSPLVPGSPPGGGDTPGQPPGGGEVPPGTTPDNGVAGGENSSGGGGAGGGGGGVAGAESGGGGGVVSTGGGDASLPFTGFAAAMVGAVGAGMAATGAVLRRTLRRRSAGKGDTPDAWRDL
jgi:hypothetical protein